MRLQVLFFVPVLSCLALIKIGDILNISAKKKLTASTEWAVKKLYIATALVGLPVLFFALFGSSLFDFSSVGDQRYISQGADVSAFIADRRSLMKGDSWRSMLLILLTGGAIWSALKKKVKFSYILPFISILIIYDLIGVSTRYISHQDFKTPTQAQKDDFEMRPVDRQIKSLEPDRSKYRVQDLTINTNNSSATSFYHNTVGGYDPAKLRRFQDVLTKYIAENNQAVYNMLNTKYFIVNGENGPQIQQNQGALGNAWFVSSILPANTPDEEFNALGRLDPKVAAVYQSSEFRSELQGFVPKKDSLGFIELISYEPDRLVYNTSAASDQMAVFSEIWYNGNRDWKSYLDGKEYKHVRVNYFLRGMKVPAGQHEIVFEFKPVVYAQGETISLISWWILVLGVLAFIGYKLLPFYQKLNKGK